MSSPIPPKPELLQEDIALPDAPGDPPVEEDANSTTKHDTEVPDAEPQTPPPDVASPASLPASVKKEELEELENLFTDDDDYEEDFLEDIDDADILASEVGAVYILNLSSSSPNPRGLTEIVKFNRS